MGHLFDDPIVPRDEQPAEPEAPAPERGTQEWARAKLAEIYKRIEVAGPPTYTSIRFREKLGATVREMVQDGVGILSIENYVNIRIREHEYGSIR